MKLQKFVAVFDNHGDMVDDSAESAFFEFCKQWKPTVRIHGGDFVDMRPLRRGASDEERADGISDDFDRGVAFLRQLNPQVVVLGNHDDRLWDHASNNTNGGIRQLCSMLIGSILDKMPNTRFIEYNKRTGFFPLGQYRLMHGFHGGINALKQAVAVYQNVIMGHIHANGYVVTSDINQSEGYSSGCLARLELGYNKKSPGTLRQAHGWAYGVLKGNLAQVWLAKKLGDSWVYPSEIKNG